MAELDMAERERLEAEHETAYGTSYPIRNCEDLRNAVHAYGRAPVEKRAELRRFIIRRHQELGCSEELPESWRR